MRRIAVAVLVLVAAMAVLVAGAGGHAQLHLAVKPARGYPTTRFQIAFTAPRAARYVVVATASCQRVEAGPVRARKGQRVHVSVSPACLGTVRVRVRRWHSSTTLASTSFRVVSPGSDTTPPTFAGIQSAFACTPGPQRPGETTPFTLTWKPATDNQTPSSQIIYEVFMSTTSGGEDFSKPSWTTPPGVTTFKTPGLASHGTFYFVVRARDQAGNEDQSKVERRGVDPCL